MALVREACKNIRNFETAKKEVLGIFGLDSLFVEQEEAIRNYILGKHVFFVAPTGYGKSLVFHSLPYFVDILSDSLLGTSTLLVVSPLIALMTDQVAILNGKGVNSLSLNDANSMRDLVTRSGEVIHSVIFCSPESLSLKKWRNFFSSGEFRNACIGIVIDEAHCVTSW